MIFLQRGDRLPTVALIQIILNTKYGGTIKVDGSFGPQTELGIRQFQHATNCSVSSGKMDNATWRRLNRWSNLTVADTIDLCDPQLLASLDEALEYNNNILAIGCMSNGVSGAINLILDNSRPGSVALLRIIGHGTDAIQAVGIGRGIADLFGEEYAIKGHPKKLSAEQAEISKQVHRYSTMSGSTKGLKYVKNYIARLKPIFSPYGSIEFHGCHVGRGKEGKDFLQDVSDLLGVPVSASTATQKTGHNKRFRGPIVSAFPGGGDLQRWAASLPSLNMSFP
jgi:hypothetical protein